MTNKPPTPRPTLADTPESEYLFRSEREPMRSRAELRVLTALAKLGTGHEAIEAIVTKQVANPVMVLRLAGLPPLDLRTEHGKHLVALYERRRGSLR